MNSANKEVIFVICDTDYEASQLYRGSMQMIKADVNIVMDNANKTITAGDYIFKFASKYDMDNNRLKGFPRPNSIMTRGQFLEQILGEEEKR